MLDFAARLALSPLLLSQALLVRSRALVLPEAGGARSGVLGSGPPLMLLVLGDSSAAGVGVGDQGEALAGQLAGLLSRHFTVSWQLRARTGATTASTLRGLGSAQAEPFDVIVTALGVNDVIRAVPRAIWLRRQRALIARLRALHTPRRIYLSGMPPMGRFPLLPQPLRWTLGRAAAGFDAGLFRMLEHDPVARHVPFDLPLDPGLMAEDGFHPNAALYALWAKEMASRIISDWPSNQAGS